MKKKMKKQSETPWGDIPKDKLKIGSGYNNHASRHDPGPAVRHEINAIEETHFHVYYWSDRGGIRGSYYVEIGV